MIPILFVPASGLDVTLEIRSPCSRISSLQPEDRKPSEVQVQSLQIGRSLGRELGGKGTSRAELVWRSWWRVPDRMMLMPVLVMAVVLVVEQGQGPNIAPLESKTLRELRVLDADVTFDFRHTKASGSVSPAPRCLRLARWRGFESASGLFEV